jgi:hypothetical protein
MGALIDRGPSPPLGFAATYAASLVAFLNMLRLTFLFVGVTGFISSWHNSFIPWRF